MDYATCTDHIPTTCYTLIYNRKKKLIARNSAYSRLEPLGLEVPGYLDDTLVKSRTESLEEGRAHV